MSVDEGYIYGGGSGQGVRSKRERVERGDGMAWVGIAWSLLLSWAGRLCV